MGCVVRSDIPCVHGVSVIKWSVPHTPTQKPLGDAANLALRVDHKQFRNPNVILIQVNMFDITLPLVISAIICLGSFTRSQTPNKHARCLGSFVSLFHRSGLP